MMPAEKFGRYEAEAKERVQEKEKDSGKKQGAIGETLGAMRGIEPRDRKTKERISTAQWTSRKR